MRIIWLALLLSPFRGLTGQDLSFFHLDKSDGLSDNTVTSVISDENGLIWIGTLNGLNSYDGYTVRNFFVRDFPGLQTDVISRLVCDHMNRIWIQGVDGSLSVLDEKREFRPITLTTGNEHIRVDYLLPVSGMPMFLSNGRLYSLEDKSTLKFVPTIMDEESLFKNKFERINLWDEDHLVFSGSDQLFLFDFKTLKASPTVNVTGIMAAARFTADTAIVTTTDERKLLKVNLTAGAIAEAYNGVKDQYNEPMHRYPGSIQHLQDKKFLIASPTAGVYTFDAGSKELKRYAFDNLDDHSISADHTTYLFECNGEFDFIATAGSGLNYFKRNTSMAKTKTVFYDQISGRIYNGHISSIVEDAFGNLWFGGGNTLIRWNRVNGKTTFLMPSNKKEASEWGRIRTLFVDKGTNRIWIGATTGLVTMGQDHNKITHLKRGSLLPDNSINSLVKSPDGLIWVSTSEGIYFVEPNSFEIILPNENSPLRHVQKLYCNVVWFQDDTNVWIATRSGAFHINLADDHFEKLTTTDGLVFDEVTGFAEGNHGEVYIGTRFGFHILKPDRSIQAYNKINDMWPIDCHSLLRDGSGNVWFANRDYLAFYSPATERFYTFDDQAGITPYGFQFYSAATSGNGELLFGLNRGIAYFKPEHIKAPATPGAVIVNEMSSHNHRYQVPSGTVIELPFAANSVSFSFSAVNLLRGKNMFYQYRLHNIEKQWTKASVSSREVAYHNLQPGSYIFDVRASGDGIQWVEAVNPVSFIILTPWWKKDWFMLTGLLFVSTILVLVVRRRSLKMQRQREQLDVEQTINYLATSIHEQETVDAILWDVARNCIGRLKFEDCVIYTLDQDRKVLTQKAAWGPKTTDENKIVHPIEIPIGKGIVGHVAANGKAEIVKDTTVDDRYIVDDIARQSEITVPIIYDNRVLGVIDSEHSTKGFFTPKHLSILTTIAAICANKIIRFKAEEEKKQAQLELLVHERKMVEAQLKSLRLQMNPHFLFNSLNTIQQMILANDETAATRYLSKFSRLLRLVLGHADKDTLMLKDELETLQLYIELESLRFKDSFRYSIVCDHTIDPEEIRIPAMLIQPFVENAIWHGLLHKQGERKLSLNFSEDAVENLVCVIEDNGIGREAAGRIGNEEHTGKGMAMAEERLCTYNDHQAVKSRICIEDLKDENGNGSGTRIILTLPLL